MVRPAESKTLKIGTPVSGQVAEGLCALLCKEWMWPVCEGIVQTINCESE